LSELESAQKRWPSVAAGCSSGGCAVITHLTLLEDADLLCLSGVFPDAPPGGQRAAAGIPLTNDSQIFMEIAPAK